MNMMLRRHHDRTDRDAIAPGKIERTAEEQAAYDEALAGGHPATPETSAEQSAQEQREHQEHREEQIIAQEAQQAEQREAEAAQGDEPQPTEAERFAALERPKGNASTETWRQYVSQDPQRPDGYEELDRAALVALYPAE